MEPKRPFKQASITSFFSGKRTSSSHSGAPPRQESAQPKKDAAPIVSAPKESLGRQRLASAQPTHDPFSGQGPSSSRSTVMADDMGSTSPDSSRPKATLDLASSISLGYSRDAVPSLSSPPAVLSFRPHVTSSPALPIDKPMEDRSGWSSPSRPSTPIPIPSQALASEAIKTPTRNLFGQSDAASTVGKRTAGMAAFSPQKSRPPTKLVRTSPIPSLRSANGASPSTSSPQIMSSPMSPAVAKSTFSRDAEIRGSDDEDDMSDCSLPDIDAFVPSRRKTEDAAPTSKQPSPDRKGKFKSSLRSPLPLQSKVKAKFDLKTLLDHQRKDDAMNAAFEKHEQAEAKAAEERKVLDGNVVTNSPSTVRQQFINVAGVQDETAGRALRAMERTESANSEQNFWYFFKPSHDLSKERPKPFPKTAAKGPWSLLVKEGTRRHHIQSGFFYKVTAKSQIPDEIFEWMLDAIRFETSTTVREAYVDILCSAGSGPLRRMVTPECLRGVYRGLGAVDELDSEHLQPVQEREVAYPDRDWTSLQAYLRLLGRIAAHLTQECVEHAVVSLLRMATDHALVRNPEVLCCHQSTLVELVEAVDSASWDSFCEKTASSLFKAFPRDSLRVKPLLCVSLGTIRIRELRRRLARAFFHNDVSLAGEHPDCESAIPDVLARLMDSEFKMQRKTDYVKLRAQAQLMDIALDDGSFVAGEDAEAERVFNDDIDELATRLRGIWSSINDAGALYLSRTQAKSAIDCLQKRMTYAQRTKPIPKQSLFDLPTKRDEVPSVKSKAFMSKFLSNLKKPRAESTPDSIVCKGSVVVGDDGSSDIDETFITAVGD